MKNYLKIKTTILLLMTTSITYSQCLINYNNNGTNLTFFAFEELGQGFTSLCDGELEYVQFVANSTGIITAGTLKIYNGNKNVFLENQSMSLNILWEKSISGDNSP